MATPRDPWFDNIKMTLVTLVVVGHSWTLLPHNTANDWTYDFLYA
jgi:fucose 4-O-acetylase-like acetyltransferase